MNTLIVAVLAGILPMVPALALYLLQRHIPPAKRMDGLVKGLMGFNVVLALMVIGVSLVWLATPAKVQAAAPLGQETTTAADPYTSLAAALSTGLATIGAGIAVGNTGSAAVGTIAEKPESFGRALIFVGLAEGIAIYGLIISFMILNR
jgi:V/A-type H+-transporting ATPase subunit K